MKAGIWRSLMAVGMRLHQLASPHPPSPSFVVKIPSRISSKRGKFKLIFYVPEEYHDVTDHERRFPVVVNFHGGGFTLGRGTDDARWAMVVMDKSKAVVVSVEYRLAPEYPFSIGVEDGTDALFYLAAHADELRLDPHRFALSGFSAGGNYALTIPLMLYDLLHDTGKRSFPYRDNQHPLSSSSSKTSIRSRASASGAGPVEQTYTSTSTLSLPIKTLLPTELEMAKKIPSLSLRAIVAFYPPTDFRIPRSEKRSTHSRPDLNIPPVLTKLFDKSYLSLKHGSQKVDFSDPYLSPAAASDELLKNAYPENVILYTCEFDMLNAEGTAFGERLSSDPINKSVKGGSILGVPHAFDRKPNPIKFSKVATRCYQEACAELNVAFGRRESVEERHQLDLDGHINRFEHEIERSRRPELV